MVAISGFQASDIGQYGIGDLTWWTDPLFGDDFWRVPVPVGALFDIFKPWRDPPARIGVPPMGVLGTGGPTASVGGPLAGTEALPAPLVIDPDFRSTATVFEDAPGGIYETNRAPTDWGGVYDAYVILNPETPKEEPVGLFDAVDWGSVAGTIVGGLFDPFGAGAAVQTAFAPTAVVPTMQGVPSLGGPAGVQAMTPTGGGCPPIGPKYAKICLATREITPLRRRRRRRLLTSSDIKDLAALKAIVGGAALQGAVVQAIRR